MGQSVTTIQSIMGYCVCTTHHGNVWGGRNKPDGKAYSYIYKDYLQVTRPRQIISLKIRFTSHSVILSKVVNQRDGHDAVHLETLGTLFRCYKFYSQNHGIGMI